MNPNKKKELIESVKLGYQKYRMDLLDYYTQGKKIDNISASSSPEEYYNGDSNETMMLKPNIYFYLNKEERRILKAIMAKKPGYEKIKLGE